ncbi:MAG: DUF5667 domain-containing protein [Chloroflexi bacterium]|nr:DUF5667 domain-containing protein [Chloroflexota bacterium]
MDIREQEREQEIVEDCLELLRQGRSLKECLAQYPDDAAELEPMLRVAVSAQSDLAATLPSSARTRIRDRVMSEWDRQHQPSRWNLRIPSFLSGWALSPRVAFATAILVLALTLGGLGTTTAAANTVPGDVLYPVKEFREGVQLWFARSPEAKVEMYTSLVKERVDEVSKIAAQDQADVAAISDALARMEGHLTALNSVVDSNVTDSGAGADDSGFVKALQESIGDQDAAGGLLIEALDRVPEDVRPAFTNALNAIQSAQDRVHSALETVGQSGFNDR